MHALAVRAAPGTSHLELTHLELTHLRYLSAPKHQSQGVPPGAAICMVANEGAVNLS